MIEATSCGGVVIFRGKILVLYKNYRNKYEGWVLPKGTVEAGEEFKETALREVKEETGVQAQIIKYIGKSQYSFNNAAGYGGKGSPTGILNDGRTVITVNHSAKNTS